MTCRSTLSFYIIKTLKKMKHFVLINIIIALGVLTLQAQDTTVVQKYKPVNNYSGLNSLMKRLANPSWNGAQTQIGTGLKLEQGTISPLNGTSQNATTSPVTSLGSYAGENAEPLSLYLREMGLGKVPVGPPVFVFFRLAGSYITDSAQLLNIHAAADLAIAQGLRVRITGAADSATGSADKNAALATARAEHVAKLFMERGVPEEKILTRSEGGIITYEPISANRNCQIELFIDNSD